MGKASKCICVDTCHKLVKYLTKLMKLEDPCMNDSPLSLSVSLSPFSSLPPRVCVCGCEY